MATTPHKVRLHRLEASPWGCALFPARGEAGHIFSGANLWRRGERGWALLFIGVRQGLDDPHKNPLREMRVFCWHQRCQQVLESEKE